MGIGEGVVSGVGSMVVVKTVLPPLVPVSSSLELLKEYFLWVKVYFWGLHQLERGLAML
jgi:hypothetical protein